MYFFLRSRQRSRLIIANDPNVGDCYYADAGYLFVSEFHILSIAYNSFQSFNLRLWLQLHSMVMLAPQVDERARRSRGRAVVGARRSRARDPRLLN